MYACMHYLLQAKIHSLEQRDTDTTQPGSSVKEVRATIALWICVFQVYAYMYVCMYVADCFAFSSRQCEEYLSASHQSLERIQRRLEQRWTIAGTHTYICIHSVIHTLILDHLPLPIINCYILNWAEAHTCMHTYIQLNSVLLSCRFAWPLWRPRTPPWPQPTMTWSIRYNRSIMYVYIMYVCMYVYICIAFNHFSS